ncbi:MAG: BREX system ATP-binding protein BrxD [Planctomycetaceae bacterium]|nr:BREX system ATP-binding protein BrxD [Planctomycetaceae bacterium]
MHLSKQRRQDIISALRRGTVPSNSLDKFAVGLGHFENAIDQELADVKIGRAVFKAVRGEYGCGKTFFSRWIADKAQRMGFATSEVQISETETPLYRLEKVYRRINERLSTVDTPEGALRNIIDSWFFALEQDVLAEGEIDESNERLLLEKTNELLEKRLSALGDKAQTFSLALRGYRRAQAANDLATADGISAWLAGQPNVAAAAKRYAGIKGDIDHFGALTSLQGVLAILQDSGFSGLLIVLDEVETIQRMRSDVREKSLNALRQLIDEIDAGRFPGLYLLITGTTAFFEGPQGIKRLEPLAQRLHVDFKTDARFDNPRSPQIRLSPFDMDRLCEVGIKIRDIYALHTESKERIRLLCNDEYIRKLAYAVSGELGGKVGIAPRIFLKKLVGDVLDRIDQFDDFNPEEHYALTIDDTEMTTVERQAFGASDVDDIEIEL